MSGDVKMRRATTTKGMNDIPGHRPGAGVTSEAVHDPMLAIPSEMVTHIPPSTQMNKSSKRFREGWDT
jgi:hypothetical protein